MKRRIEFYRERLKTAMLTPESSRVMIKYYNKKIDELQHCEKYLDYKFVVGEKIKFKTETTKYTIRAVSERFVICTRPYNPKKTVIYSIIDLSEMVRGPSDRLFGKYSYKEDSECLKALCDLVNGDINVSSRNSILLDIEDGSENE